MRSLALAITLTAATCGGHLTLAAEPRGYQAEVKVSAPTRLDWTFALANQSLAEPPADWIKGYQSTEQRYELFVPPNLNTKKSAPLVLFISPSDKPSGWAQWQKVCQQSGVIFASPFEAGNNCPIPRRVRIVLDVLDDVRRRQKIDSDRTYLAGFSGGARIACSVAFALPEYFGGIAAVCGAEKLREESWLRQRVIDRLSVALITGETDFNRSELERLREPMLTGVGVRTQVVTVPKLGHGIPDDRQLAKVFAWLEEGLPERQKLARQWPATRLDEDASPTRAAAADALLAEARQRLMQPKSLYSGLMQLQGLRVRWGDVPAAKAALEILTEYDSRADRPWEADDLAEQKRFLLAQARSLDRYATGPLPSQYSKQRGDMARGALELWRQVLGSEPTPAVEKEGQARLVDLERTAAEAK